VFEIVRMSENTNTTELVAAVRSTDADAIIVQLPLPADVDMKEVCDAIPVEKDADVLSCTARENFEKGEVGALLPPVIGAVREIFEKNSLEIRDKRTVVVGEGFLVGAPVAVWLTQQGARVNIIDTPASFAGARVTLAQADIIIAGAGSPHLIKPEMVKEGVVLIDAGTSESGGIIVGDADLACALRCSLFTPVPGGIGPLAVAFLFENAVTLAEKTAKTHAQSHSVRV
jgi:methylenetetrahydrofolate dehydrogenase (NADP+)/methenyltetrahydrofolate cyclohydrolase